MVRHNAPCGVCSVQPNDTARRADLQNGAIKIRLRSVVNAIVRGRNAVEKTQTDFLERSIPKA